MEDILALGEDPFPPGSKLLRGSRIYSMRVYRGLHRAVYMLSKGRVLIIRVRPRATAYRGL